MKWQKWGTPNHNIGLGTFIRRVVEAVRWYRKAAKQGNSKAQSNLGLMYSNSEGVPQDYIEAHKWYNLAASRSQGEVHENSVHNRDITEKRMTPAQVAEAQKLAREWKPKPAQ